jgi:hypothetical protein
METLRPKIGMLDYPSIRFINNSYSVTQEYIFIGFT